MDIEKRHADEFWKLFHKAKFHSKNRNDEDSDDQVSVYTGSGISTPKHNKYEEVPKGPERDPLKIFHNNVSANIFRRLNVDDLKSCARVCKRWRKSSTLNYVWFEIFRERFFEGESNESIAGKWTRRESRQDWKLIYKSAQSRPFSSAYDEDMSGYVTPKEMREAEWARESTPDPLTKNEQREIYKSMKGRKPRSKGNRGDTNRHIRDVGGFINDE